MYLLCKDANVVANAPCALQSAVIVALLNIQIPLILGSLVNVVAGIRSSDQLQELRPYGVRLMVHYALQVCCLLPTRSGKIFFSQKRFSENARKYVEIWACWRDLYRAAVQKIHTNTE